MRVRHHLVVAALAAALGLAVLSGSGATLARWGETSLLGTGPLKAGRLKYTQTPVTYRVTRRDWVVGATSTSQIETKPPLDVTANISTYQFIPGDVIEISTDVTINAVGNNLVAELRIKPPAQLTGFNQDSTANADLTTELAVAGNQSSSVTPLPGSPALVSAGTNRWRITPANNGFVYRVATTVKVRATNNGQARSATRPGNWWMDKLQNTRTSSSTMGISLVQIPT